MTGMEISATRHGLARIDDGEVAVVDLPHPDVAALLRAGGTLADVERAPVVLRLPVDDLDEVVLGPLGAPTVWGVGLNYHAKAALTGRATPTFPILYVKAGTALGSPRDRLVVADGFTDQLDYEGEVGVVVGGWLSDVDPEDVWDNVAGFVCGNDVTARDVMKKHANPLLAKSMPRVGTLGPTVLPVSAVADRDDIGVRTWWNGDLVQDGRTSDLIFPVAELLSIISRYAALAPGDVVLTGTPPGTGQDLGRFLRPGDDLRIQVEGMRALTTTVGSPRLAGVTG